MPALIEGVSLTDTQAVLEFIYLDELSDDVGWDNSQPSRTERSKAVSLFAAARTFQLSHMFLLLEWHYSRTIDPTNAMWLATIAFEAEAPVFLMKAK